MLLLSGLGLFFAVFLLAYNKGYKSANVYLALFLFLFNLLILINYFFLYYDSKIFIALLLSFPIYSISFLLGPLAFLYVRSILSNSNSLVKYDWVHFIVFAFIFIGRLPNCFMSWEEKLTIADEIINHSWNKLSYLNLNNFLKIKLNYKLKAIQFIAYLLAIWYIILKNKTKKKLLGESQEKVTMEEKWLTFFASMLSLFTIIIIMIVVNFLNAADKISFLFTGNIFFLLTFVGFLMLILGLIFYPQILYGIVLERESLIINANESSISEKGKIETISYDEDYIEKIRLLLLNWIEQKKYLDAESTTSSLSKDIDLPIHHVTYFFNNVNDEKYIEWRNRNRIEYAMSLINSKNGYNKTIENLGKESGFKSYSAFIQSFKQITGKLPKDYIRDLKI